MTGLKLNLVVAACGASLGIGNKGELPWRLPKEMKHFAKLTTTTSDPGKQNVVIMGRKTWDSIPRKFKPLKNRFNVVLTRNRDFKVDSDEVVLCTSFEEALKAVEGNMEFLEKIFVIGGSSVYKEAIGSASCHRIYLTEIDNNFECDVFFPALPGTYVAVGDPEISDESQREGDTAYRYKIFEKRL